jgi:hypothetical protein
MRPRLIPLLFLFSFYSQAQLSSGQPFVALVADNVYKNGHLPVTNLEHFKGNEILYVRGFLSLVHRSGLSWEFRDTVVHLAGMGIPKIKKAQFDGFDQWISKEFSWKERMNNLSAVTICVVQDIIVTNPPFEIVDLNGDSGNLLVEWQPYKTSSSYLFVIRDIADRIISSDTIHGYQHCYRRVNSDSKLEIVEISALNDPSKKTVFGVKFSNFGPNTLRPCEFKSVTEAVVFAFYEELFGLPDFENLSARCLSVWQQAGEFEEFHYFHAYYESFKLRHNIP